MISRLAVVELRCLLRRRVRMGDIDAAYEHGAIASFEDDVCSGFLQIEPLSDVDLSTARNLIGRLTAHPLRTLDALHLAAALNVPAGLVATADRVLARAADALGLSVVTFGRNGS